MKVCPQCAKTYEDFFESCLVDLAPLEFVTANLQNNSMSQDLVGSSVMSSNAMSINNQTPNIDATIKFKSPLKQNLMEQAQSKLVKQSAQNIPIATSQNKDELIGKVLDGRYEILEILGRGGMGVVYKARQVQMERIVAIKILYGHKVSNIDAIKAFKDEAKSIAQIKHHHIITLLDFGMDEKGQPYLVMDYLQGIDLHKFTTSIGVLSLNQAKDIFKQLINGLTFAHKIGVVHKDLKPENIMLTNRNNIDNWVTILDFGLASLKPKNKPSYGKVSNVVANTPIGSPPYMSPEQCLASDDITAKSDIYSLGIILFEILSGTLPFDAKSPLELMNCHVSRPPHVLSQINEHCMPYKALSNVIAKMLEKEPANRYKDLSELEIALNDAFEKDTFNVKVEAQRKEASGYNEEFTNELKQIQSNSLYTLDDLEESKSNPAVAITETIKPKDDTFLDKVKTFIYGLFNKDNWPTINVPRNSVNINQKLATCGYCGIPAQPGIKFCMNCQRQIISSHELTKIRRSQGDYSLRSNFRGSRDKVQFEKSKVASSPINFDIVKIIIFTFITGGILFAGYGYINQAKNATQDKPKQVLPTKKKTGKYSKYKRHKLKSTKKKTRSKSSK